MKNFIDIRQAKKFEASALDYLLSATERFFGCKVSYHSSPIENLQRKGINIRENPKRGVYLVNDSTAYILGRVLERSELVAVFSIKLMDGRFSHLKNFLNIYEAALALTLSQSYKFKFQDRPQQFGDDLIQLAISKFFSKGRYDHRKFLFLLDVFRKLSNTTFEGRNFTTGLILTRSMYAYAEKGNNFRFGKVYSLEEPARINPVAGIQKRFWYLADGQTAFFMAGRDLIIKNIFLLSPNEGQTSSFVDDYSLSKTIMGADALFRVAGQSEFSVMGSYQLEFVFKDNYWRVRSFEELATIIKSQLTVSDPWLQSFLFFVFMMSRRRASSLIWVPEDHSTIHNLTLSVNRLTKEGLSILEPGHSQSIYRLLSSDGATIVNIDGTISAFGAVVDIAKAKVKGIRGTGESVASVLATNGVAIKVSQDGGIKVFTQQDSKPLLF